jgi:hypothetical protein|tara:strand:- start:190 stop:699 length:510 start_codon:yes stop_codon:yes gene_type:complete
VLVALPIRADDVVAFFFEAFREVRGCSFREGGGEIGQRTRSGVDGFLFFETKALARCYTNHLHNHLAMIERKDDDDDDDRERRGFYSFSAAFLFNQSRQLRERRQKKTRGGGGGGVSAKPSEDRDHSVPQHPKERKKERKKMTDDAPINPPAPVTHILSFASGQYGSDP